MLLVLALIAVAIVPLTGNALGLDRYLAAIVRWTLGPKRYAAGATAKPLRGGVLLSSVPLALTDAAVSDHGEWWQGEDERAAGQDGSALRSDQGGS